MDGVKVSVNGRKQKIESAPGSYFTLDREWRNGDTVKVQMPMRLHTEFLPDTTNQVAVLYGPIVLAGDLGTTNMPNPLARDQNQFNRTRDPATPVLVTALDTLLKHVKPVSGKPLTFKTRGIGQPEDATLIPFYEIHRERYTVYWTVFNKAEWKAKSAQTDTAH